MTIDEEISSPLIRQRHSLDILVCTVAISLLLHIVAAIIMALPGRVSVPGPKAVFLELQNMPDAGTASPAVEPAAEPQLQPPVPEAVVPESAPESGRLERAADQALRAANQTPEAVHESSIGLGMLSGHFASFAEGASLKDEIREYYFVLMRRVNEVWWTSGVARGAFANGASVTLIISRDGRVVGAELLDSTGNREQDMVLLETVKAAGPLPPLPASYRWPTFNAPVRFVPPLRLMLPGAGARNRPLPRHGE